MNTVAARTRSEPLLALYAAAAVVCLAVASAGCGGKVVVDATPPNAIALPYDTPAALPPDVFSPGAPGAYPPGTLVVVASNTPEVCATPLPDGFGASSCDGPWRWTLWLVLPPEQQEAGTFSLNTNGAFTNVKDCNGVVTNGLAGKLTVESIDESTIAATMSGVTSKSAFDTNETIVAQRCP